MMMVIVNQRELKIMQNFTANLKTFLVHSERKECIIIIIIIIYYLFI
jgi:hypothetical protein